MPEEKGCTLEDVRRALEVGLAKIDGRLTSIEKHIDRTDVEILGLETRVSQLERRVWTASGAAALVGTSIPFLLKLAGQ